MAQRNSTRSVLVAFTALLTPLLLSLMVACGGGSSSNPSPPPLVGGSWQALNGPYEGPLNNLVQTPSSTIFAGFSGAGVFLSVDNGNTWSPVNTGLANTNIRGLAVSSGGDLYAATQGPNGGVYKLPSGSSTWQVFNSGLPNMPNNSSPWINAIAFQASSGDFYAGPALAKTVYRLPAGSNVWQATGQIPSGTTQGCVQKQLAISPAGTIYLACSAGIFISTNSGGTWTAAGAIPGGLASSVAFDPTNNVLYAGGTLDKFNLNSSGGISRSTDGGVTWTNTAFISQTFNTIFVAGSQVYAGSLSLSGFGSLYVSSNQGVSWNTVTTGLSGVSPVLSFIRLQNGAFILGANGAFTSPDGSNWSKSTSGLLAARPINAIQLTSNGDIYVAGSQLGDTTVNAHGVARSKDGGVTWTQLDTGLLAINISSFTLNRLGDVIAGDHFRTAYRLIGNGNTWTPSNLNASVGVNTMVTTASNSILAGTPDLGGHGYFVSTDDGNTYSNSNPLVNAQYFSLYQNPFNNQILAGTEANGLMISTDNGQTFTAIGHAPGITGNMLIVGVAPNGTVLTGQANQSLQCYLGGSSWANCGNGIGITVYNGIVLDNSRTHVYLSTNKGVFFSTDPQGAGWTALPSLPYVPGPLAMDSSGNLYLGTSGGFYKLNPSGN